MSIYLRAKVFEVFWYIVRNRVAITGCAIVEAVRAIVNGTHISKLDGLAHQEVRFCEVVRLLVFLFTLMVAICRRVRVGGAYIRQVETSEKRWYVHVYLHLV